MWELDHKASWLPKNWCFWTVVLEKNLETVRRSNQSILKEISPEYSLEGMLMLNIQESWIFTDVEAEAPIFWPPDAKNWLFGKNPDSGKDWGQEEKWATEDKIVGWHHWAQWTWVWVNSRNWWWTGKAGVLSSMGLQRFRHNWVTELTCCCC